MHVLCFRVGGVEAEAYYIAASLFFNETLDFFTVCLQIHISAGFVEMSDRHDEKYEMVLHLMTN